MMELTQVVNLRYAAFDVYIGRAGFGYDGYFGNPFTGDGAIEKFRVYFQERVEKDVEYRRRVEELRGKRLGCFCKPRDCHGDVIAMHLNGPAGGE